MEYKIMELRPYMIDENCGVFEMLNEIPAVSEFEVNEFCGLSKIEMKELIYKKMKKEYGVELANNDVPQILYIFLQMANLFV